MQQRTPTIMTGIPDLSEKDLYNILGCSKDSTFEELKQAYHRKLLESHPDKNDNSVKNVKVFCDVKLAWEVLGNPDLKKVYDDKCKQADLETESAIIYAKLSPSELESTEDEDILSYQCRCGNSYLVLKTDLEQANSVIHVPCQDCTFVIAIET